MSTVKYELISKKSSRVCAGLEHLKVSNTLMFEGARGVGLWVSQGRNPLQSGTYRFMWVTNVRYSLISVRNSTVGDPDWETAVQRLRTESKSLERN